MITIVKLDGDEVRAILKSHVVGILNMDMAGKKVTVRSSYSGYEYEVTIEDAEEAEDLDENSPGMEIVEAKAQEVTA